MIDFGKRLKELRDGAGLTQQALAEAAGLSKDAIYSIEAGKRRPTWDTAIALAGALGVTCEAFTKERVAPGRRK